MIGGYRRPAVLCEELAQVSGGEPARHGVEPDAVDEQWDDSGFDPQGDRQPARAGLSQNWCPQTVRLPEAGTTPLQGQMLARIRTRCRLNGVGHRR